MTLLVELGKAPAISGRRVTITELNGETTYMFPRRPVRVSMTDIGRGRCQLSIGGFNSTSVVVIGRQDHVAELCSAVLA